MERLDKIELVYKRVEGKALMYDGTTVTATVYTKTGNYGQENNPPFQRYLDIMIEGAKHFKVHQKHIDLLKSHKRVPRPLPHEFKTFEEPAKDSPLMTYEKDVEPFDGKSSPTFRLAVNGKVIEICMDDVKNPLFFKSLEFFKQFGQRLELALSRVSCKSSGEYLPKSFDDDFCDLLDSPIFFSYSGDV